MFNAKKDESTEPPKENEYVSLLISLFVVVIMFLVINFMVKKVNYDNNKYDNLIKDLDNKDNDKKHIRLNNDELYERNRIYNVNDLKDIMNDIYTHRKANTDEKLNEQILEVWNILNNFIDKNYITRAYSNEDMIYSTKKGELEIMTNIITNTGIINGNVLNESIRNIDGESDSEPVEFIYLDPERKINNLCNKIDIIINLIKNNIGNIHSLDLYTLNKLRNDLKKVTGCNKNCKCRCLGGCFNPLQPYNNYFGQIREMDADGNYSKENEKYLADEIVDLKPVKLLDTKKYANYQYPRKNTENAGGNTFLKKYPNTFNYDINSQVNQTPTKDNKSDGEFYNQFDELDKEILSKSVPYEQMLQGMENKKEGFSSPATNNQQFTNMNLDQNIINKNQQILKADMAAADDSYDIQYGDTWTAFLRNNPEGWLKRRDILPKDLLGYKFSGSFQKSLYDFDDSYQYKTLRCLQQKYRNLEDKEIFNKCMGWQ